MSLRSHKGTLLAVLAFVGSLAYLVGGIRVGSGGGDAPPFHMDEAHKAGEAYYYHLFFERRNPDDPAWTQDFYARTNPPVGKYIFGAVLAAAGHAVRDQQLQRDFDEHWRKPDELRKRVPDAVLRATRGTSAVFGALICTLVFIMAHRTAGVAAGLIALVLLLGNPYFERYVQRGLTDSILMFHLALIVPASFWATRLLRRHWQAGPESEGIRRWFVLVLGTVLVPGLVIALAAGTKLNGGLTALVYVGSLILTASAPAGVKPWWRRLGLTALVACLAGAVAAVVFVAINPYFYHDPFGRMVGALATYRDWMILQQISPGGGTFSLHQRVTAVFHSALLGGLLPLPRFMGMAGGWLTVLGFSAGVVTLAGRCLPRRPAGDGSAATDSGHPPDGSDARVIACWVVVCIGCITLWLPLVWDRYLLPPYLGIALITAIGLASLPTMAVSVLDLCAGKIKGRDLQRVLAGSLVAVGAWIVLAFTSWVISPLLLEDPSSWTDPDSVASRSDSPIVRRNFGVFLWSVGFKKQAVEEFEEAVALLGCSSGDRPGLAVQRCCLLYNLARACAGVGRRAEGIDALGKHVNMLRELREQMVSGDPFVRGAFDATIAERQGMLDSMVEARPGGAGRARQ
ncbi:MAG: hypothetical protein JXQ73_15330 [Phycisphaerae bacterium]|nr:hypothetical protein [Phycisphaerae bacterium]